MIQGKRQLFSSQGFIDNVRSFSGDHSKRSFQRKGKKNKMPFNRTPKYKFCPNVTTHQCTI